MSFGGESEEADVIVAGVEEDAGWETVLDMAGRLPVILLMEGLSLLEIDEALRSGAGAILPLTVDGESLIAAIVAVNAGLIVLPRGMVETESIGQHNAPFSRETVEALTTREREVLGIIAEGLSNKQIADRLQISDHTVKFHVASILGKLGVSSRTEAVTAAIKQGILML